MGEMMLHKNLELQQQEECYYREGLTQKEMDQFQVNMDGFKSEAEDCICKPRRIDTLR